MRRWSSIIIALAFLAIVAVPAYAPAIKYTSGDLAVKILEDTPGAVFRNVNVDDERYLFRVPVIYEFYDTDHSGNFTDSDVLVAIAVLHDLSLNVVESNGYVNITRSGDVRVIGVSGHTITYTAHVFIYLTLSNSTVNEAKRGMVIQRPRVNENDSLAVLAIFAAVDPQMNMHTCQRQHRHRVQQGAELGMQQERTKAKVEYESNCICDGHQRPVNVTAFERSYKRKHKFMLNYNGNVATQIVFPYGSEIVYDPTITVETVSALTQFLSSPAGIASITIAIILIFAAIAVVMRNKKASQ